MSSGGLGDLASALDAAAIPAFKVGPARHSRLMEPERDLYFWILRRFSSSGRPAAVHVRDAAEWLALDAGRALGALAREDLVHTGRDGEITVAYPYSGRPTEHRVRFSGGHEVHAMCALDALGIAPMFDESIEIVSRDPLTGDAIAVGLEPDGSGTWQPDESVVVCGASGSGESCCSCCPVVNFFASAANAERWLEGRPDVRGNIITMPNAIDAGRAVFGGVLEPR